MKEEEDGLETGGPPIDKNYRIGMYSVWSTFWVLRVFIVPTMSSNSWGEQRPLEPILFLNVFIFFNVRQNYSQRSRDIE